MAENLCAAQVFSCTCKLAFTHEGAHVCICEGSWDDEGNLLDLPSVAVDDRYFPIGSRPFD